MSDRLPPLQSLRALEALYLGRSVMRAAELLNVTHSAVSHQIRVLEGWTDHALFRRDGRRTSLTDAGESLAQIVHLSFDAIRHEMDRLPLRSRRPVTVAALPIIAADWLVPRLPTLLEAHPEIVLHIAYAISDQPTVPEADLTILFSEPGGAPPGARALLSGAAAPVCSPDYLARHPIAGDGDLRRATLLHDEDQRMWSLWFDAAGIEFPGASGGHRLFLEGSSLLCAAALAGHGIGLCRLALIAPHLRDGRLVRVSPTTIDTDRCYYLSPHRPDSGDPSVDTVAEWLVRQAEWAMERAPIRSEDERLAPL